MSWIFPTISAIYIAGLIVLIGEKLSIRNIKYGVKNGYFSFTVNTIKILFFVVIWPIVAFILGCKEILED